jgi:23S rRNA (pseudouridine1915-N3)-methyltransferase
LKLLIISPGKAHDPALAGSIAEYHKRLGKRFTLEWALPPAGDKASEGAAILKLLTSGDVVVLLDERGKDIDTPQFAALLDKHLQSGTKRMVFIIGGAFGVAPSVAARADLVLKLSSLVFPHMLVRLILVEQLYRAGTIIEGGKYHHA